MNPEEFPEASDEAKPKQSRPLSRREARILERENKASARRELKEHVRALEEKVKKQGEILNQHADLINGHSFTLNSLLPMYAMWRRDNGLCVCPVPKPSEGVCSLCSRPMILTLTSDEVKPDRSLDDCPDCHGKTSDEVCKTCHGTGELLKVRPDEIVEEVIPDEVLL